jgi:hypothetical protein
MALHPDFPRSPYEQLDPKVRWFPAAFLNICCSECILYAGLKARSG